MAVIHLADVNNMKGMTYLPTCGVTKWHITAMDMKNVTCLDCLFRVRDAANKRIEEVGNAKEGRPKPDRR